MLSEKLDEIFSPIAADLAGVRGEIGGQIAVMAGGFKAVVPVMKYFFGAPGKFLRSALVLLSARCVESRGKPSAVTLAAAAEMIHSASLIHDDIIDESHERRGRKSLQSMFGNKVAVLAGDLLFTHSLSVLEARFDRRILALFLGSVKRMCGGEILHLSEKLRNFKSYERFIEAKTSSLMQASCLAGALDAGADDHAAEAAGKFGLWFGTAYQLMDDHQDQDIRLEFKIDLPSAAAEYALKAERALAPLGDTVFRRSLVEMARQLVACDRGIPVRLGQDRRVAQAV